MDVEDVWPVLLRFFFSVFTKFTISSCWSSLSLWRPPKPALLARFIQTAARALARSNSAKLATIYIIMRPPAEVVLNCFSQAAKASLRLINFVLSHWRSSSLLVYAERFA